MIDILMTTFNGEKFLSTQIDSIILQTFKDWHLFIKDDCSTDRTLTILKDYEKKDSRITVIDNNEKLGVGRNFLSLLKYSSAEYIAFCDQDDYWFENKLEIMYDKISKYEKVIPTLLVSNCLVWQYPSNSISKNYNFAMPQSLNDVFFMGGMQGCLTMFNKSLKTILDRQYEYVWLHDHYLLLSAITFGRIHYLSQPLMLYRQHNANTTAHFSQKKICELGKKFTQNKFLQKKELYKETEEFYKIHNVNMLSEVKKKYFSFLQLKKMSFLRRFIRLLFSKYTIGGSSHGYFILKLIAKPKFIG